MTEWLLVLVLACGVALGLFMAVGRLRGAPRRPYLIGTHIVLGFLALEPAVIVLRGPGDDRSPGLLVAGLISGALFCGLVSSLAAKRSRLAGTTLWAAHACFGAAALIALVVVVARLNG